MDNGNQNIEATLLLLDNKPCDDFDGLSKADMRYLIHNPFSKDSPLQINKYIPTDVLDQIHFFNQIEFFLERMIQIKELKLTGKGFLPTGFVRELYTQGFIKEDIIEDGTLKLYAEKSSESVHLTRQFVEFCGFLETRQNRLILTPKWRELIQSRCRLDIFFRILSTFTQKFNWENIGFSPNSNTSQIGFAFSLFLLSKYGQIKRPDMFYVDKYIKAYPFTVAELTPMYRGVYEASSFPFSYLTRTIEVFFVYFNFANCQFIEGADRDTNHLINKTQIFDKIMTFEK